MRKYFLATFFLFVFVLFLEPAQKLMSKFLMLEEPTTYEIREGDWLSKIAKRNYGDVSYWKELALINRAPDGHLIFPGEKVVVPSFDAIQEIRNSRSLSSVNEIVGIQEDILAGRIEYKTEPLAEREQQEADSEFLAESEESASSEMGDEQQPARVQTGDQERALSTEEATNGAEETAFFLSTPVLIAIVAIAALLIAGIFVYNRRKKREEEEFTYYGDSSEEEDEDREDGSRKKSVYYFNEYEKEEDEDEDSKRKKKVRETETVS